MHDVAPITVQRIESPQRVIDFLLQARSDMFGSRIDPRDVPADLQDFVGHYLPPHGCMLAAFDTAEKLLGTIAYRAYDRRFPQLQFEDEKKIVEVVRLYVHPNARRAGLATRLFDALKLEAKASGCEILYLHTHPFLRGAIEFWRSNAFEILTRDPDPVWQTVHMSARLRC